jgi:hypothetical protein
MSNLPGVRKRAHRVRRPGPQGAGGQRAWETNDARRRGQQKSAAGRGLCAGMDAGAFTHMPLVSKNSPPGKPPSIVHNAVLCQRLPWRGHV